MTKKKKPMTAAEKKFRAEIREEMREKGLLSPVKKPLNRKKFIEEARADYRNTIRLYDDIYVIEMAFNWMLAAFRPSLETVGTAKVLKISAEIKRFMDDKKATGADCTYDELYEHIRPTLDA